MRPRADPIFPRRLIPHRQRLCHSAKLPLGLHSLEPLIWPQSLSMAVAQWPGKRLDRTVSHQEFVSLTIRRCSHIVQAGEKRRLNFLIAKACLSNTAGRLKSRAYPSRLRFHLCNGLEGAIRSKVKGVSRRRELGRIPGDHHAVSANASETEPARLLAVFVVDTEKNLVTNDK